ncbi:ribonuclease HII [bacterium]|nr:ribonuclease HII [bacterium]
MAKRIWIDDGSVEVGLDEAGRGSLWGRLYVGAVIMAPDDEAYFDNGVVLRQITDSKALTRRKRAVLADWIRENAIEAVVNWAEPEEIDTVNILRADMAAMHRALSTMEIPFQRILVDGDYWLPWSGGAGVTEPVPAITICEGDAKSLPIAAASIIAKEAHDAWVRAEVAAQPVLDERYGLSRNMGYGTAEHIAGLKKWGPAVGHRKSFAPVRSAAPLFRSGGGAAGK